jgi:hypothetical protein
MPELPKRKVGIVACCGEEMPEGTITRLAALKVLESLRPEHTVTICLPLFLAGGEGDRAFARFYPTIAVDGCAKRCAARGTEMYSGKPAVSIVVGDIQPLDPGALGSARRLSLTGKGAAETAADQIAQNVPRLLDLTWDRRSGSPSGGVQAQEESAPQQATCSCGSGIPLQNLKIDGADVQLIALPLIFARFRDDGRPADESTEIELMQAVAIYNPIPEGREAAYAEAILREYAGFCRGRN